MSDEEKKAIERLNIYKEKIKDELYPIIDFEEEKAIGIILNLIEKQQKEIEELKEESKEYQIGFAQGCYEKDLDWEDKIKEKIEAIKTNKLRYFHIAPENWAINILQSLLEKE